MCTTFQVYIGNYIKVNIPNFDISEFVGSINDDNIADMIESYFWNGTEHFQSNEYSVIFPQRKDVNGEYVSINDTVWSQHIPLAKVSTAWLYTSEWFNLLNQLSIHNISYSIEYGVIVSRT